MEHDPKTCMNCQKRDGFFDELEALLNKYGYDDDAGVPDFMLAEHLMRTLDALIDLQNDTAAFFEEVRQVEIESKEKAS